VKIAVIGSGYVGLVVGACLAETGNEVSCADVDQAKIDGLKQTILPIYEPGLDSLVERNQSQGRLRFTTDVPAAVSAAEVVFIAVGTPPDEDGSADLRHVLAVADVIGEHMGRELVVVTKSTVPVGTAAKVAAAVGKRARYPFHMCSNPEFLKEGAALDDFMKPDRVVLGVDSDHARSVMAELYAPFVRTGKPIIFMDIPSAEMTKYAANAMLATKISFMNEMANVAERVGADIEKVRLGIGSDPRIGYSFIYPGAGYGGSCFPKDVKALVHSAREHGLEAHLLASVEAVNERQKSVLFEKINSYFQGNLSGRTLALWGLAFKPNTDDMREAPSRTLMDALWSAGATVRAYDPVAMPEARRAYGERADLVLADSAERALAGADALAILTEWQEFRSPDFDGIRDALRSPAIFDGRNLYDPALVRSFGLRYFAIGRGEPLTG
jgi:UDPglucose 6-dehydrogenase